MRRVYLHLIQFRSVSYCFVTIVNHSENILTERKRKRKRKKARLMTKQQ